MEYTIGQVSEMMGLPTPTLRYYEDAGLLPDVSRTESGRRVYSDGDIEALRVIGCLKESGLSIREIRGFVEMAVEGDATIPQRLALFRERLGGVEAQIAELERMRGILEFKRWYYETALELGGEAAVRALTEDQVPERHRAARAYLRAFD